MSQSSVCPLVRMEYGECAVSSWNLRAMDVMTPIVPAPRTLEAVRGPHDAALGDDRGDQRGRRDVEGGVVHGRAVRRRGVRADTAHLATVALLDRDVGAR